MLCRIESFACKVDSRSRKIESFARKIETMLDRIERIACRIESSVREIDSRVRRVETMDDRIHSRACRTDSFSDRIQAVLRANCRVRGSDHPVRQSDRFARSQDWPLARMRSTPASSTFIRCKAPSAPSLIGRRLLEKVEAGATAYGGRSSPRRR